MNTIVPSPMKPLALTLACILLTTQAAWAAPQPSLKEDISVSPGRSIGTDDEALISAAAQRVLRHVARARTAIAGKDVEGAQRELRQAETLMNIIQRTAPTTVVKERLATTDDKLKYENTEEVGPAFVPIYGALGERVVFDAETLKPAAGDKARGADDKAAPREEAEAGDVVLYYEGMDLPVNATRHFIAVAEAQLAKKRYTEADQALRAAQDAVDFTGVYLDEPLLAARINLERAHAHYAAGRTEAARADVTRAIAQLDKAAKTADPDSRADVDKLRTDAKTLAGRLDGKDAGAVNQLKRLWRHTEALADRAKEATVVGWAKLRSHGPVRADLIEAKRYAAYADIDANVAREPDKVRADLTRARDFLERAAKVAAGNSGAEVYIKDARAMVDSLLAGQAKTDPGEMANLKNLLGQAIGKL